MNALVVDTHTTVRAGLRCLLLAEWPDASIGLASRANDSLEMLDQHHWDLFIFDICEPGIDGLALLREVKSRAPGTRVLAHCAQPEDHFGVRALRAGADGYVTKNSSVETLIGAVKKVTSGGRYVTAALGELMADALSSALPTQSLDILSDREMQILRMISSGSSPSEIAHDLQLSIKTVSTYRSRILEKLRLRTTADLIKFALENNVIS